MQRLRRKVRKKLIAISVLGTLSLAAVLFVSYTNAGRVAYIKAWVALGHVEAQHSLGEAHVRGEGFWEGIVETNSDEVYFRVPINKVKGLKLLESAAVVSKEANYSLGSLYLYGDEVPRDFTTAFHYLSKADPSYELAAMHAFGLGIPKNELEAANLLERCTSRNEYLDFAHVLLAEFYLDGLGVSEDTERAVTILKNYSGDYHRNPLAQFHMGIAHKEGVGVSQNARLAKDYFTKAAQQGHLGSQTELGLAYIKTRKDAEDVLEGYAWLTIAAARGYLPAKVAKEKLESQLSNTQLAAGKQKALELSDDWPDRGSGNMWERRHCPPTTYSDYWKSLLREVPDRPSSGAAIPMQNPSVGQTSSVDPCVEWNKIVQFLNSPIPKRYWIMNCEDPTGLSQSDVQSNGTYNGGGVEKGQYGDQAVHSRYIEPSLANHDFDFQSNSGTIEWRIYNKNVLEKQVIAGGDYVKLIDKKEFLQVRCTLRLSDGWSIEKIEQKEWKEGDPEPVLYRLANKAKYKAFFEKSVSSALPQ